MVSTQGFVEPIHLSRFLGVMIVDLTPSIYCFMSLQWHCRPAPMDKLPTKRFLHGVKLILREHQLIKIKERFCWVLIFFFVFLELSHLKYCKVASRSTYMLLFRKSSLWGCYKPRHVLKQDVFLFINSKPKKVTVCTLCIPYFLIKGHYLN